MHLASTRKTERFAPGAHSNNADYKYTHSYATMPSPFNLRGILRRTLIGPTAEEKYGIVSRPRAQPQLQPVPPPPLPPPPPPPPPPPTFALADLVNLVLHKPYTQHLASCAGGHYLYLFTDAVVGIVVEVRERKTILPRHCLDTDFLRVCIALIIIVRKVPSAEAVNLMVDLIERLAHAAAIRQRKSAGGRSTATATTATTAATTARTTWVDVLEGIKASGNATESLDNDLCKRGEVARGQQS